jgi:hypothetical protein
MNLRYPLLRAIFNQEIAYQIECDVLVTTQSVNTLRCHEISNVQPNPEGV